MGSQMRVSITLIIPSRPPETMMSSFQSETRTVLFINKSKEVLTVNDKTSNISKWPSSHPNARDLPLLLNLTEVTSNGDGGADISSVFGLINVSSVDRANAMISCFDQSIGEM